MRHQKKTIKLGRTAAHRKALLANQVCSLIAHQRVKTTLAKAKAVRPLAERMVTFGKNGSLHARRMALSILRQKDAVKKLYAAQVIEEKEPKEKPAKKQKEAAPPPKEAAAPRVEEPKSKKRKWFGGKSKEAAK